MILIPDLSQRRYPADPQDAVPVAYCEQCDTEIYEGEQVWEWDGVQLCTRDCVCDYVAPDLVTAGK